MRVQLLKLWDRIHTSFWFVPSLMAIGATVLSFASVRLDHEVTDEWLSRQEWAYTGGAESASAVLGTVAGSMITIAGVVFSLTLVALSLASSQFGPRLLRNFMSDATNQSVLGTFIATFLYCLLVLRTIRRPEEGGFVPHLSITLGLVFAVASLGVLIYFIHHVARSIQADQIIARVSDELAASIDRLFPEDVGKGTSIDPPRAPNLDTLDWQIVGAPTDGYLQLVDLEALLEIACKHDLVIRIERKPGHYAVRDSALAFAAPRRPTTSVVKLDIAAAFVLGSQRSPAQDVEFSVHQLVEIALRALSPGINDPFTAITCIDRLASALYQLVRREMPSPIRTDQHGTVRLIAQPPSFAAILDAALTPIREQSVALSVSRRLLDLIIAVAQGAHRTEDREALRRHALMIERRNQAQTQEPHDREELTARFNAAIAALTSSAVRR